MGTPKLSAEGAKFEAPSIERRRREKRGEVGEGCPLPSRLGDLGERRKLPQRGPGGAPAANAFCHILGSIKHLFGQQNAF